MQRALDISSITYKQYPTRIVFGYLGINKIYHVETQVFVNDMWQYVSIDQEGKSYTFSEIKLFIPIMTKTYKRYLDYIKALTFK